MLENVLALHGDFGAGLQIRFVEAPQPLAAIPLRAGVGVLQIGQEVAQLFPLFFVKVGRVLQEFAQIPPVTFQIAPVEEALNQNFGRVKGQGAPRFQVELFGDGVQDVFGERPGAVAHAHRAAALADQRFDGDKEAFALPAFLRQPVFVEVVQAFAPPLARFALFLAHDLPGGLIPQRQRADKRKQVGFAGAEFGLNPIPLANGAVAARRDVGSGHLPQDVVQKRAHRIDEELFNRADLGLAILPGGRAAAVAPDVVFHDVDADDVVGNGDDFIESLALEQRFGHGNFPVIMGRRMGCGDECSVYSLVTSHKWLSATRLGGIVRWKRSAAS